MPRKLHYDFWVEVCAQNRIAKKFEKAGVTPFPEVDLARAALIIKISEKRILSALRRWKLPGRRVGNKHLIKIVDLWDFAVSLEMEKIERKNRR